MLIRRTNKAVGPAIGRVACFLPLLVAWAPGCGDGPAGVDTSSQSDPAPRVAKINPASFYEAAANGQTDLVRRAIEQGADVNESGTDGRTALMLAAYEGHTGTVKALLEHDARIDERDATRRTALIYSASGPHAETVRVLLEAGADVNVVDNVESWTALMFAAAEGHVDVVRVLLKHQADTSLRDKDGDTAGDFAAQNGHHDVVGLLGE